VEQDYIFKIPKEHRAMYKPRKNKFDKVALIVTIFSFLIFLGTSYGVLLLLSNATGISLKELFLMWLL
jgi:hypothetical protein